jgi:metallophosphoesterase superfamily enzyme
MAKPRKRNKRIYCTDEEYKVLKKMQKKIKIESSDNQNILVIGDLHEPFCLDGYLSHCKETYHKYKCNKVVFIGDIIDNHYSSYHETDANGMGGADELEFAIDKIAKWYKAFPDADVCIGNHDRIIMRKAQTSAIPSKWIKKYKDVLETPNWNFTEEVIYNNVRYVHGDKSSKARTAAKRDMMSTVTGHFHTDLYVEWFFGKTRAIFAMGVGCGINSKSYAMGYMQGGKKEAVACGVVLNNGLTPITIPMEL